MIFRDDLAKTAKSANLTIFHDDCAKTTNLSRAFLGLIYMSLSPFVIGLAEFTFGVFAVFVALLQNFVIFVNLETEFNFGHI